MLPRIFPVTATAGRGDHGGAHARALLTAAAETEIDGLRQHIPGSPAARIRWASLAKGGELMERQADRGGGLAAAGGARPARRASQAQLDAAVRAAASLVVHFARAHGLRLLLPGDRRPPSIERADLRAAGRPRTSGSRWSRSRAARPCRPPRTAVA